MDNIPEVGAHNWTKISSVFVTGAVDPEVSSSVLVGATTGYTFFRILKSEMAFILDMLTEKAGEFSFPVIYIIPSGDLRGE